MKVDSLKLAFFSPTGTTKKIVEAIAQGVDIPSVELLDITKPDARNVKLQTGDNELLVVAVPVYIGRVPALLGEWLKAIEADKTPTVCVVVYGNREYDDALLELRDILSSRGANPIGCAAFIGEHSYSSEEVPIAVSRPDASDLNLAQDFGRKVCDVLQSISSFDDVAEIKVEGNHPYIELHDLLSVDFQSVGEGCTQCGVCAEGCPVDAIDHEDFSSVDTEKCVLCCACIKSCPEGVRIMKDGMVKDIAKRVQGMCQERKEPVFFF